MELSEVLNQVKSLIEAQKNFYNDRLDQVEKKGVSPELIKRLDQVEVTINRVMKHGTGILTTAGPTLGDDFIKSEAYTVFKKTNQRQSGMFEKAGPIIHPTYPLTVQRVDGARNVYPQLVLRQLLVPRTTTASMIEYLRQKASTGAAAVQTPEGSVKAQVDIGFELAQAAVVTIAAWTKASTQCLEDDAELQSIIDGELMYQVDLAEEKEILNGDGTTGHMQGLLPVAPAFTGTTGQTAVDVVGSAIAQLEASGYRVTGTALNPVDWNTVAQLKTTEGVYLIGNPGQGPTALYLWNRPVVTSAQMPAGTFLTGAFGTAAQLFDRSQAVEVARNNEDDFVRNLVTFRGERRSALAIRRPAGFLKGSTTAPVGAAAARSVK